MEMWREDQIKKPILQRHQKRFLEIAELSDHEAWSQAMAFVDIMLSEEEALIFMLNQVINYRYGGIDFWANESGAREYQVKFGYSKYFKANSWQAGLAKAYLALRNRKVEDDEIKKALKEEEDERAGQSI